MRLTYDTLTIRNATKEDAGTLAAWWNDGKIMAHAGFPYGLSLSVNDVAESLKKDSDETGRRLIIEEKGQPIGEMNYKNLGDGVAEIGIKICIFSRQNRGRGRILLSMLISELFGPMQYEKIVLDTNLHNKRAQHVYELLGFRKVGIRINAWEDQTGEVQSSVDYELRPCDFIRRSASVQVKKIGASNKEDVRLPNQPFQLYGKMVPTYLNENWGYHIIHFDEVNEMCFPEEEYDYDRMKEDHIFLGAYAGGQCIGLAVLKHSWNQYLYLYDLKVNRQYRKIGVGRKLLERAGAIAYENGYQGIYTQAQDNNLAACMFYDSCGFQIRGMDTGVYKGTPQEGKNDILFYWDL